LVEVDAVAGFLDRIAELEVEERRRVLMDRSVSTRLETVTVCRAELRAFAPASRVDLESLPVVLGRASGASARSTVDAPWRCTFLSSPSGRTIRTSRPSMVVLRSAIRASGTGRPTYRSTSARVGEADVVVTLDLPTAWVATS
jgi:hypothetical protein